MTNHNEEKQALLPRSLAIPRASWLGALPIVACLAAGCCPAPDTVAKLPDNAQHLEAAKGRLAAAEQKKVWTAEDERAFSRNLANLSQESHLALAVQLARDINTKAIHVERPTRRGPEPPICPCVPGLCEATPPAPTPAPAMSAPPTAGMAPPAAPAPMRKK